ncbi:MAG TPA: M20/M25/M40 family metallo-hydrolase [Allosphingosinicella sp.]|nr:M20/M25/M40 family metallo-hydrolase [Allosphingosinicella sp.]
MKRAAAFLGLAALLLAAMALKGALLVLPSPPAQANGPGFDANRAMARLTRILGDQRPHPVDSDAGDAVRERLLAEMRAVGLNPRVSDDFACNSFARSRTIACARVRNLVATIGPAEGRHVLLVSHYDSTFAGPGAGDDGIGTAAMLEIAQALRGKRLARPVTFLFNEGEEMGLLGARAFLERDPLAARVDTAINMEARGVNGPAIMFETSRPNGAAISLYRAAAPRPVANSLSTDLYRLIPNSTDVAVFEARPWTILNFAVIGNETRYHSAGDDLAALSASSLQHMGSQALAVTEHAASGPAQEIEGERLYTDIAGLGLIVLPMLFGLVLLGVLLLFFLVEGWRRRALGMPLLAMAVALAGSAALAWLGHFVVGLLRAGDFWRAWPIVTTSAVYASAIAACLIGLLLVARTAERTRLRAAFWLLFLALGAGLCVVAPGGAIYFLAPPLLAALGMAGRRWWAKAEQAGAIAAAFVLYLTFGPALGLFEELLSSGPLWVFAPLGAAIMLPALIELVPLLARMRTLFAVAGGMDLAILGWLAAGLTPAYSADKQQLFTIEYVWDQAAGSARFAVNNDGAPVPLEAAWERVEMPYTTRRRWAAPAPAAAVQPPMIEEIGKTGSGPGQRVRLRLRMNGAQTVTLIAPGSAALRGAGAPDFMQRFGPPAGDERYFIRCIGRACDGALLDIAANGEVPPFAVIGSRPGLPAAASPLVSARPQTARPQYGPDSTITLSGSIRPAP